MYFPTHKNKNFTHLESAKFSYMTKYGMTLLLVSTTDYLKGVTSDKQIAHFSNWNEIVVIGALISPQILDLFCKQMGERGSTKLFLLDLILINKNLSDEVNVMETEKMQPCNSQILNIKLN